MFIVFAEISMMLWSRVFCELFRSGRWSSCERSSRIELLQNKCFQNISRIRFVDESLKIETLYSDSFDCIRAFRMKTSFDRSYYNSRNVWPLLEYILTYRLDVSSRIYFANELARQKVNVLNDLFKRRVAIIFRFKRNLLHVACRNHIKICNCEIRCSCNHMICTISIASLRRAIMIR